MTGTKFHNDPVGSSTLAIISKADRFNRWMFEEIRPFLKGSILEVGSGIGNISQFLVPGDMEITLSDYNRDYHDHLKKRFSSFENLRGVVDIDLQHPEFSRQYGDLREKYDSIFMLNVIEHLENDLEACINCRYMLRGGGNLVVLAPAYQFLYCKLDRELGHYRRYSLKTLVPVIKNAGFRIIHKSYFNALGTAGWLVSGKLLGSGALGKNEMSAFNRLVPLARFTDKISFRRIGLSAIVVGQKK